MKTPGSHKFADIEIQQGRRAAKNARGHFTKLRDIRCRRGKRVSRIDVVLISFMAMICGCDDADDMAQWAELREEWLTQWFDLAHGAVVRREAVRTKLRLLAEQK